MSKYIKYGTKAKSLAEVKAWNKGESEYLKNLIGVGFYKHLFICENGNIDFFYEYEEWKKFHKKLKEILNDSFFDQICRDYMILIGKINNAFSEKQINDIDEKLWPIQSIFNEIDECPYIASNYILSKLFKIRTETHLKHYELRKKEKE